MKFNLFYYVFSLFKFPIQNRESKGCLPMGWVPFSSHPDCGAVMRYMPDRRNQNKRGGFRWLASSDSFEGHIEGLTFMTAMLLSL